MLKYFNPLNWYYFCKGYLKSFIIRQQNEALVTVGNRASKCPECWNSPDSCCVECGCQIPEVWLSGKQCSKSKFLSLDEAKRLNN